jgi:hypothetical protein
MASPLDSRGLRIALLAASLALPACGPPGGGSTGGAGAPPGGTGGPGSSRFLFVDVARDSGIDFRHDRGESPARHMYETFSGGVAWLDHDGDGDPDLFFVSGQPLGPDGRYPRQGKDRMYRNDGGRFSDITAATGLAGHGYGTGVAVGDMDNDGDPDLYVVGFAENILYRNRGDGTFEEVESSGIKSPEPFTGSALFADVDGDGLLDLFLAVYVHYDFLRPERCFERSLITGQPVPTYPGPVNYAGTPDHLYRNLGNGTFREVSREAGIGLGEDAGSKSLGSVAADFDDDGDVDIYVACDTTPNLLYRNRGHGTFDEIGMESGCAASDAGIYEGSMGIALGDQNGDGIADFFVTNFQGESNRLYLGNGKGAYIDGTASTGLGLGSMGLVGWGTAFFDADRDGRDELFVSNGHIYQNIEEWATGTLGRQPLLLYTADGPRYRELGAEAGAAFEKKWQYRGAAFADYDLDGDVDIAVLALDAPPILLRNDSSPGHWLEVDLVGKGPGGRDAIGAKVEVQAGSLRLHRWRFGGGSYVSASEGRLHFGLGREDKVGRIVVSWPGGGTTVIENVPADRRMVIGR